MLTIKSLLAKAEPILEAICEWFLLRKTAVSLGIKMALSRVKEAVKASKE